MPVYAPAIYVSAHIKMLYVDYNGEFTSYSVFLLHHIRVHIMAKQSFNESTLNIVQFLGYTVMLKVMCFYPFAADTDVRQYDAYVT